MKDWLITIIPLVMALGGLIAGCGQETKKMPSGKIDTVAFQKDGRFDGALTAFIKGRRIYKNVNVSMMIVDMETEAALAALDIDRSHMPASAVKIFTAAAALKILGTGYRYKTRFYLHEETLYIKGGGDSFLNKAALETAVGELIKKGLKSVKTIIYDDSYFDTGHIRVANPGCARHLFAPPSALTYQFNAIPLRVTTGAKVRVRAVIPTSYARIRHELIFENSFKAMHPAMVLRRYPWGDAYHLKGTFSKWNLTYDYFHLAVSRPGLYAATALKDILAEKGIDRPIRLASGRVPAELKPAVVHLSDELLRTTAELCKYSNNVVAKNLCLTLGARKYKKSGTMADGVKAIRETLMAFGLKNDKFFIDDASGLSRKNRFTARQFCRVMTHVFRSPIGEALIASLSIQGKDRHSRKVVPPAHLDIREKSGTLSVSGVNTLAGFIHNKNNGRRYCFAILASRGHAGRKVYSGTYTNPLLTRMITLLDEDGGTGGK